MKSLSPNDNHIETCWVLHNVLNKYHYGTHPVVFAIKQTTFVQSITTQVCFKPLDLPHMYATCFDLYLSHRQACQNKEHTLEDITKIRGSLDFYYIFWCMFLVLT